MYIKDPTLTSSSATFQVANDWHARVALNFQSKSLTSDFAFLVKARDDFDDTTHHTPSGNLTKLWNKTFSFYRYNRSR